MADRSSRHHPSVETPDLALTQATSWAIRRVGGHLRSNPARAVRGEIWSDDDLAGLLEDARTWQRIRSDDCLDAEEFLGRVVGGLLGVHLDGIGGRLEISPTLPEGWRSLTVRRLRANRSLLDLEVKARSEWLTIKIALMFGPPIPAMISSPTRSVARVTVDDIVVDGPRAAFTIEAEHDVALYYGL